MDPNLLLLLELLTGEKLLATCNRGEIIGLENVIVSARVTIDYLTKDHEIKTIEWAKNRPINFQ